MARDLAGPRCDAPGPEGMDCEGPAGHTGFHGLGDERWDDRAAERYLRERNAQHLADAMTPAVAEVPDQGTVYSTSAQRWEGVIKLTEYGPLVVLDQPGNVAQVLLPWAMVLRITWADQRRT